MIHFKQLFTFNHIIFRTTELPGTVMPPGQFCFTVCFQKDFRSVQKSTISRTFYSLHLISWKTIAIILDPQETHGRKSICLCIWRVKFSQLTECALWFVAVKWLHFSRQNLRIWCPINQITEKCFGNMCTYEECFKHYAAHLISFAICISKEIPHTAKLDCDRIRWPCCSFTFVTLPWMWWTKATFFSISPNVGHSFRLWVAGRWWIDFMLVSYAEYLHETLQHTESLSS